MSEFCRPFDARHLPAGPQILEADASERKAVAHRFGLVAIHSLRAVMTLQSDGPVVRATGQLEAGIVQSCAISGEDLPVTIDEPVALRFVPAVRREASEEELELSADDCDEIEMEANQFDLGEAIAQSLALAIDPYATGPGADAVRSGSGLLGEQASGPFAALSALKKGR